MYILLIGQEYLIKEQYIKYFRDITKWDFWRRTNIKSTGSGTFHKRFNKSKWDLMEVRIAKILIVDFFTCHDRSAVVACAKFWHDLIIIFMFCEQHWCTDTSVWALMMTSSNENIFRVTGHLCGEFTGDRGEIPAQRPVTRSFDAFFDLRLNKRLSKP